MVYLVLVIILIFIAVYLYFNFMRIAEFFHFERKKIIIKISIAAIIGVLFILSVTVCTDIAIIILYYILISLLIELINIILKKKKSWRRIYMCGIVPIAATMLIFVYGYWNMSRVKETKYEIFTEKTIREEGYRVAMISDLHYGLSLDSSELKKYCRKIENEKPDLVVLCGDIVDESTTFEQMQEAINILGSINSTYGTFYVYGNHDKNNYLGGIHYDENKLSKELNENKINILQDQTYLINDELLIVGREERSSYRMSSEELLSNINKDEFILILDHQPCDLDENDRLGADLQLSGHTHGGQLWPMGLISNALGINEMNYGYKKLNNLQVITSSGVSGWGSPIRTEGKSEYVIIDIKSN